jgi:nucleoside-diphosphate-sugar epimerase
MLQGQTVLVTGGTGFIGGRLVEKLVLEEGCNVRVLVRNFAKASRIAAYPVEMLPGAITERDAVAAAIQGCDVVFHCAHDFAPDLEDQRRANVEAARNLAELCLQNEVSRLVYLSSVAAYSPATEGDLTESSPWPPSEDAYVLVKREVESLLRTLHEENGLPVVMLQPTIVYGPFSTIWTLSPVRRLRAGIVPLVNGGDGVCNAVYVDDVVDAMLLAAVRPEVAGEVFLISGEEPVTWKNYYQALERAAGVKSTVEMSETEVRGLLEERQRRRRFSTRVKRRLRSPGTWSLFGQLAVVRAAMKLVPDAVLASAAERWLETGDPKAKGKGPDGRGIQLPNEGAIKIETSKAKARIDKAKRLLGYSPRFDLERGMEVTRRYLEWANLAEIPGGISPLRNAPRI